MYNYFKQKWAVILERVKRINKRKLVIFSLIIVGIIICFIPLFVFQARVNRDANENLGLATFYYQQAQDVEYKEERLDKLQEVKLLYQNILSSFWVRDKKMPLFYLGNCLYSLGEYKEASEILQKFDRKYGNDYFAPWAKMKLAASYEQIKEYKEAINSYKKILEKHPQSSICPQALLGVARCQGLQGEWSEAQKSYEEILSRYPLSEEKGVSEIMLQRLRVQTKL
jgi:TolA-binding protein